MSAKLVYQSWVRQHSRAITANQMRFMPVPQRRNAPFFVPIGYRWKLNPGFFDPQRMRTRNNILPGMLSIPNFNRKRDDFKWSLIALANFTHSENAQKCRSAFRHGRAGGSFWEILADANPIEPHR